MKKGIKKNKVAPASSVAPPASLTAKTKSKYGPNIVTILTLVIALVGGIPGLIGIINDKAKCKVTETNLLIGDIDGDSCFVLFSCSIVNDGNKPMFPKEYSGDIIFNNKVVNMTTTVCPPNMDSITSPNVTFKYSDVGKMDLLTVKKISPTDVVYGNLLFQFSKKNKMEILQLAEVIFRLTIKDINDEEFVFKFPIEINPNWNILGNRHLPNSGIIINPK